MKPVPVLVSASDLAPGKKASRSESKPDLADAATRSPTSQITSTSTVTVTWTTHPSTQSELELEQTPGLLPSQVRYLKR